MKHYTYQEIEIGTQEEFKVTITEQMMLQFNIITGDCNPLHDDKTFAQTKGYQDKVVYGMLTASFLSTLAGMYLPGENSIIYSTEIKFTKPVYVGDELSINGIVTEKNEHFSVFKMKVTICNNKGEKVLRGFMQIGVSE